jgi:hypothetical protein
VHHAACSNISSTLSQHITVCIPPLCVESEQIDDQGAQARCHHLALQASNCSRRHADNT